MRCLVKPIIFFLLTIVSLLAVYGPGLEGPYVFDDFPNIVNNPSIRSDEWNLEGFKQAIFSVKSGPLYRPVSMASFVLNEYLWGESVVAYRLVNLLIHTFSALGLYCLASLLATSMVRLEILPKPESKYVISLLAGAVALIWALHPLNLTSVEYIVQRMAALAGMFVFWGCAAFVQGRLSMLDGKPGAYWYFGVVLFCLFVGVLSKESAILLPMFCVVFEVFVFRLSGMSSFLASWVRWILVLAGLIFVFSSIYVLCNPSFLRDLYSDRYFTQNERVLTEARVVWSYLRLILVPDITSMSLFHDDAILSKGIIDPPITFVAVIGWLAVVGLLIYSSITGSFSILAMGFAFFLVGHLLESTVIPLELMHEHRNYVPMGGLLLGIVLASYRKLGAENKVHLLLPCCGVLIMVVAITTAIRVGHWVNWPTLVLTEVVTNSNSSRSQYEAGVWYFQQMESAKEQGEKNKFYDLSKKHLLASYHLTPDDSSALLGLVRLNDQVDKPAEDEWLQQLFFRLSTKPFGSPTVTFVADLLRCEMKGYCHLGREIIEPLIGKCLSNPTLKKSGRAAILSDAAIMNVQYGEFSLANSYMDEALRLVPNDGHIHSLATEVAIISKNYDKAAQLIKDMETSFPKMKKERQTLVDFYAKETASNDRS